MRRQGSSEFSKFPGSLLRHNNVPGASAAPHCAVRSDYLSDTPMHIHGEFGCLNVQRFRCDAPPTTIRTRCAIPPVQDGHLSHGRNAPSAILSQEGIARQGGYLVSSNLLLSFPSSKRSCQAMLKTPKLFAPKPFRGPKRAHTSRKSQKAVPLQQRELKRWGFQQMRGYQRNRPFSLTCLDLPRAVRPLHERAPKGGKGRFPGRDSTPTCYTRRCGCPTMCPLWFLSSTFRLCFVVSG